MGVFKMDKTTFIKYEMKISFKTTKQMLKAYNHLYLNLGYLGDLEILRNEKAIILKVIKFNHIIEENIRLIEKKKLNPLKITLKTEKIERTEEVLYLKELKGGIKKDGTNKTNFKRY